MPVANGVAVKPGGTFSPCPAYATVRGPLLAERCRPGGGSEAGSMRNRRPISCSAAKFSRSVSLVRGARALHEIDAHA